MQSKAAALSISLTVAKGNVISMSQAVRQRYLAPDVCSSPPCLLPETSAKACLQLDSRICADQTPCVFHSLLTGSACPEAPFKSDQLPLWPTPMFAWCALRSST